jgi:ArsR family transcriptional regulator, arsenate/arsenite/antimonite-responsive transcriptional repressor
MPMKDIVNIFKALADPTRLRIVLLLLRRELCVCELMFILRMEQSRVSHHMRVLRDAGIAEDVREGRWIIYRLPEAARPLLESLLSGTLRDRIEHSGEAEADARKLDVCVRDNVRGRACEAPSRAEGS